MNPRNTWRWLVAVTVLLASILVHQRYFKKQPAGPERILSELKTARVNSIQILRPAGQLEIWVNRANSGWHLGKPISYRGHSGNIETLLEILSTLVPVTTISAAELKNRPQADEEFGFANPQASIVIDQDTSKVHLLVGGITGPGDQVYVQVVGLEPVYVVRADFLKLIPRTADDWRDTALLDLEIVDFDHVTVTNGGKLYVEFARDSIHSPWRMIRPLHLRAHSGKIGQSLEALKRIRITKFVSDDPKTDLEAVGLKNAELELTLGQGTNVLTHLQFGKTNQDGQIYARRLGQHTIVTVPKELITVWRAPVNDFRNPHLIAPVGTIDSFGIQGEDTFSVARQSDDQWTVLPNNFPADSALMKELISVLTQSRIDFVQDVVTESGLANWGLAPPLRRITLQSKSGSASNFIADLHFGARETNRVFVRRTDEPSVYAISTNDFDRLPAASWQLRERRLWSFNENDIASATIRKDNKMIRIIRKDIYKWIIAPGSQGLIKNELALEETMRGLVEVRALFWVARGEKARLHYGVQSNSLHITLDMKSGQQAKIEFGSEASPISVYAATTFSDVPIIFEFPWILFRDLLTSMPVF